MKKCEGALKLSTAARTECGKRYTAAVRTVRPTRVSQLALLDAWIAFANADRDTEYHKHKVSALKHLIEELRTLRRREIRVKDAYKAADKRDEEVATALRHKIEAKFAGAEEIPMEDVIVISDAESEDPMEREDAAKVLLGLGGA